MPAYRVLYQQSLGRIQTLVNKQNADTPVPACPGWTIRDTVAHLLGVFVDALARSLGDGDEWSASHIARVQGRSLGDLMAEWHHRANTTPGIFEIYGAVLVADLVTHEFDIRGALGNTQARDLPVVRSVTLFYLEALDHVWREEGIPPLRIVTESKALDIGGDDPQTSVAIGWWELGRLASGRRSPEQVRAYAWSQDPSPWLDHLFVFGPREEALVE